MALIGKIRNNMWFVLVLLGFALAAFVIMDMTSASNMGGSGSPIIGEVAGESIELNQFNRTEQIMFGGSTDTYRNKESVWNYYVEKAILEREAEETGISFSEKQMMELAFGANPSPRIRQQFSNPQTQQINFQVLNEYKQRVESGNWENQGIKAQWDEIEKDLKKFTIQEKVGQLVNKSIYTPTWLAEMKGNETSTRVDFEYVKISFDQVDDSEITVTDQDYADYLNENAYLYESEEETRVLDYIVFDVFPTADDSTEIRSNMAGLIERMKEPSSGDSIFAVTNNGAYQEYYFNDDELPEPLKGVPAGLEVGEVYGPFVDNTLGGPTAYLTATKLIDRKIVPDSVQAQHLLRQVNPNVPGSDEAESAYIDSLLDLYNRGVQSFDSLVIKNSMDTGTSFKKGDLGTFTQGAIGIPQLNALCFYEGREGKVYKVKTLYGYHLVKINKIVFENRDPKHFLSFIRLPIVPSELTQSIVKETVDDLIGDNADMASIKEAIADNPAIQIETSAPLKINDYIFANLGSGQESREIVKWAFDPDIEVGDRCPQSFTYTDNVNYFDSKYVVVGLNEINDAGMPSVNSIKSTIDQLVKNKKKGEFLAGSIKGVDLASIASTYNTQVDTIKSVSITQKFVPGIGSEPTVIATALEMENNTMSSPIVGNSGVFLVKPVNKSVIGAPSIAQQKQSASSTIRGEVLRGLIPSMKKGEDMTDKRATFF